MELINKDEVLKIIDESGDTGEAHGDINYNCNVILTIPDNPTNGDILKAIFPDVEYKIIRKLSGCDYIEVKLDNINRHQFELDWWNAPYKRGGEK